MSKLISIAIASAFGLSLSGAMAQNVKSDQDKAQGQERVMENKEKGATGDADRERRDTDHGQASPNQSDSKAAMRCKGKTGHDKEECMEHAGHEGTASKDHDESKEHEDQEHHEHTR